MIITNTAKNTMPEQVQENMENIQALQEAINEIESGKIILKKIWENEDTSQTFPETVVPLNEENFDRFEIVFVDSTSGTNTVRIIFTKDNQSVVQYLSTKYFYEREIVFDALNNEIDISDATKNDITTSTYVVDNTLLIPVAIYGVNSEIVE